MEADLKVLEDKVTQLIHICQQLRGENTNLRQELAQAQSDARQMKDNMARAVDKLELLLANLPEESHG
ncbi:MAG: hypothetical protein LBV44_04000 [Methylobacillus sp.]|jgi:cell division protein ZapB|nr:hypothetical protein [Methylobacillus sp.]